MTMTEDINGRVKEIKQSFRLLMNGVASHSMREKGLNYHLNWGVSFTDLKQMAATYGKDYHLAIALWKENVRECKILATLIMPPGEMPQEIAELWMEQTDTQEIAEMLAFNLLQWVDYAPALAFGWISSDQMCRQVAGYSIISRLLMKGQTPDVRGINELIDQAVTALDDGSVAVRHAAFTCLQRLAQVDEAYYQIVSAAMRQKGVDFS